MIQTTKEELLKKLESLPNFDNEIENLETNDCTVLAISQAYDIPYAASWRLCKAFGRQFREGFFFNAKLASLMKMKLLDEYIGVSFSKLEPSLRHGTYLVYVDGHLFCMRDGKTLDHMKHCSEKVIRVWKVKD